MKLDHAGGHQIARNNKFRHSDGKLEPARPSATGINVQHPVALLNRRFMGMSGNDCLDAGRHGIDVDSIEIVDHVNANLFDLQKLGFPDVLRPGIYVVVATDGRYGAKAESSSRISDGPMSPPWMM